MKFTRMLAGAAVLAALVSTSSLSAAVLSNGAGGGDWSNTATWQGGALPGNNTFEIVGSDVVNMNAGDVSNNVNNSDIVDAGATLNIYTGAQLIERRANNAYTGAGTSTMNVNGGSLSVARLAPGAGNTLVVNLNDGTFEIRDGVSPPANSTINQSGGVFSSNAGTIGSQLTLSNGLLQFTSATGGFSLNSFQSWTGGTIANTFGWNASATALGNFNAKMTAGSVMDINNQYALTTAATMNFSGYGFKAAAGTVEFDVYSAAVNDNDKITTTINYTGGNAIAAAVNFLIGSGQGLPGTPADYLGQSYQLIAAGDYTNVTPTLAPTQWTVGGTLYDVTFDNHLSTDGGVTVASITPVVVPEPASLTLLALGAMTFLRRRK